MRLVAVFVLVLLALPATALGASKRDKKGDAPSPSLDLVRVGAARSGGDVLLRWTFAAAPRGRDVLAAVTPNDYVVVGVKMYGGGKVDAYVFKGGTNRYIRSYRINGRTVEVVLSSRALGRPRTVKFSSERVGSGPADDGPTIRL